MPREVKWLAYDTREVCGRAREWPWTSQVLGMDSGLETRKASDIFIEQALRTFAQLTLHALLSFHICNLKYMHKNLCISQSIQSDSSETFKFSILRTHFSRIVNKWSVSCPARFQFLTSLEIGSAIISGRVSQQYNWVPHSLTWVLAFIVSISPHTKSHLQWENSNEHIVELLMHDSSADLHDVWFVT